MLITTLLAVNELCNYAAAIRLFDGHEMKNKNLLSLMRAGCPLKNSLTWCTTGHPETK